MQTDDTLILSTTKFDTIENEQLKEAEFRAKDKTKLTQSTYFDFNGAKVSMSEKNDGAIHFEQKGQAKKIQLIDESKEDYVKQYIEQRARGA